jgi:hypothetical protein
MTMYSTSSQTSWTTRSAQINAPGDAQEMSMRRSKNKTNALHPRE